MDGVPRKNRGKARQVDPPARLLQTIQRTAPGLPHISNEKMDRTKIAELFNKYQKDKLMFSLQKAKSTDKEEAEKEKMRRDLKQKMHDFVLYGFCSPEPGTSVGDHNVYMESNGNLVFEKKMNKE